MSGHEPTVFDAVPYPGLPFPQSHPDRLATIASLHGLAAPPPQRCRVLELGCGNGGNLIPMAYVLPGSTFLGLDSAGSAIARGREQISALGLTNVTLEHVDLLDASSLGPYDYVIAHGVYSWVPAPVQERVLAIASEALVPNGIAYVSYNTLPGWHVRVAMRQMMLWHMRGSADPVERIVQARALVRFLGEAAPPHPLFAAILKDTLEHQKDEPDPFLLHDDLSEFNEPLLFTDFIERAGRHRLKFLSEADYGDMAPWRADSPGGRFLLNVGAEGAIEKQQYRDFFLFRRFRQTLLCHEDAPALREPDPGALRSLYVGASTRPKSGDPDVASDEPARFTSEAGRDLTTPHPLSKAAFLELGAVWPRWVRVPDLLSAARARVSAAGGRPVTAQDETLLLRFLLDSCGANVAQIRSTPCPFVTEVSERPRASALARLQARATTGVTNLRHENVLLEDPLVRTFLGLLDGTRDRMTIAGEMAAALRAKDPATAALAADVEKGIALNFDRVGQLALLEG